MAWRSERLSTPVLSLLLTKSLLCSSLFKQWNKNRKGIVTEYKVKAFNCVDHNKLENSEWDENIDHLTSLLRNLYVGQEATVRTRLGKMDWFQIGKGVVKAVYCHPAYLTYMQSTSWETLGWKKHKLESRLLAEISTTSDMQMTPPLWQKVKRN